MYELIINTPSLQVFRVDDTWYEAAQRGWWKKYGIEIYGGTWELKVCTRNEINYIGRWYESIGHDTYARAIYATINRVREQERRRLFNLDDDLDENTCYPF